MTGKIVDILLTWVGSRDPLWFNPRTEQQEAGPILALLAARKFDVVYLLLNLDSNSDDFRRRATAVLRACQRLFPSTQLKQKPVNLVSVTDYREVFLATNHTCQEILNEEGRIDRNYYAYLSPGTPQMQTVWVLLVQSGLLPARMIQATPPDLTPPGMPTWKEVDLSVPDFPQVVNPGETTRLVGILQIQNENLVTETRRLRAEIELLRSQEISAFSLPVGGGFHLPDHLRIQERAFLALALEQSNGNAAEAARLLGIEPAAFRARAVTLGVRQRSHFPKGQS